MNDKERKAIELAANGKRICFHTRHHWILTWLEEQEGANLADKVWRVIDRAYRAEYALRGHRAMVDYWQALEANDDDIAQMALCQMALCEACEYYGRAGDRDREVLARGLLRGVIQWGANKKQEAAHATEDQ